MKPRVALRAQMENLVRGGEAGDQRPGDIGRNGGSVISPDRITELQRDGSASKRGLGEKFCMAR